jgi:hypothetical protein
MRVRIERDRDVESEYRYKFVVDSFYGDTEAFVYEFDNGPDTVEVVLQEGSEIDINVPIAFNMHYRVRATYQNQQMVEEKQEVMRPCNFCRQGELPARV